jgi:hypothetical protein
MAFLALRGELAVSINAQHPQYEDKSPLIISALRWLCKIILSMLNILVNCRLGYYVLGILPYYHNHFVIVSGSRPHRGRCYSLTYIIHLYTSCAPNCFG